jgi:hypothetical protein
MTPPTIIVIAPLLDRAEVRLQRDKDRTKPGSVLLIVTLQRPTDALPCVAQLRIGAECPSTFHIAHGRAARLRKGALIRVEAEGYTLSRTGRGPARREALQLLRVRDISALEPASRGTDPVTNDERFALAA